jgi:hypothetical protein
LVVQRLAGRWAPFAEMTINNFIYFLIFVLLTVSQSIFGQDAEDCLDENCLETLHFDSVHLNSNIPLMLKDDELEDYLGKPDSIAIENDWYCGNYIDMEESVRILYYGRTKFISSKGTSLLYVLNLEEDGYFGVTVPPFSVKQCHFERCCNYTKFLTFSF